MAPQVVIAGAGPTGLVLALWLSRLGIGVRIVDKAPEGVAIPGAGTFDFFDARLRLTGQGKSVSRWSVPAWLVPRGRKPLTFDRNPGRWKCSTGDVELKTVGRGQEFVLAADAYPEVWPWVLGLIREGLV